MGSIVPSELNNTIWKSVSGGVRIRLPDESDLQARAWGNFETFHSNNHGLTAAPSRNGSRITLMQRVPTNDTGGMVQWSKALGSKNYFTVGTDWRWVDGDSLEQAMNGTSTAVMTNRTSGGTQISTGVFIQDLISVTDQFQLTLSARLDHWKNYDAHNLQFNAATGAPSGSKSAIVQRRATRYRALRIRRTPSAAPGSALSTISPTRFRSGAA